MLVCPFNWGFSFTVLKSIFLLLFIIPIPCFTVSALEYLALTNRIKFTIENVSLRHKYAME